MNKIKSLILILALTAGLGVSFAASDTLLVNTTATANTQQTASYMTVNPLDGGSKTKLLFK